MAILQIILYSSIFTVIFVSLHFLFLYFFSLKKIVHTLIPFILSNLICLYLIKEIELNKLFYNSFIINFTIFFIYVELLSLVKRGFTLSIITSIKKKLLYKELIKSYANGRGAKWILLDRLSNLNKLKIISLNKNIRLTMLGLFLSIILIFLRKIFSIKDFG